MTVKNYIDTQLGTALTTDPVVTLFTYLKNNWSQSTGYSPPAVSAIKFDSKFGLNTGSMNWIIVERMPSIDEDITIGRLYKRIRDNMRIQIFCQGSSAINNRWNIEMHVRSIIDANPTAMRTSGIDEVAITSFQPIITDYDSDSDVTEKTPATKGNWISRSKALCTMMYYLSSQ